MQADQDPLPWGRGARRRGGRDLVRLVRGPQALGDVAPAGPDGRGRFFLQCHYGRRDIAQRLRTTDEANQVSPAAASRAATPRERSLIGLHEPFFYDG